MVRSVLVGLLALTTGCCSTPGFRLAWEFYSPPSISGNQVLNPMPLAPTTAYLAEVPSNQPAMTRQYYQVPVAAPAPQAPAAPFAPQRQLLPMPKADLPKANVCEPGPCNQG